MYLENKWKCEKVFLYTGIDNNDLKSFNEFDEITRIGCIVKSKTIFSYKKPSKNVTIECIKCGTKNSENVNMGYNDKSNCDVDLTVDAMDLSDKDTEFLIFTGDGDFEYLIRKVVEKGTRVYIVSSDSGSIVQGKNTKRFSVKLKSLLKNNSGKIDLIDIDSWKMKIKKDL